MRRAFRLSRRKVLAALGMRGAGQNQPTSSVRLQSDNAEGYIDNFGPTHIQGWLRHFESDLPQTLAIYDGERFLTSIAVDLPRADLLEKGFGHIARGFKLALPKELSDGNVHQVDLRLSGSPASLLRRPIFFRHALSVAGNHEQPSRENEATPQAAKKELDGTQAPPHQNVVRGGAPVEPKRTSPADPAPLHKISGAAAGKSPIKARSELPPSAENLKEAKAESARKVVNSASNQAPGSRKRQERRTSYLQDLEQLGLLQNSSLDLLYQNKETPIEAVTRRLRRERAFWIEQGESPECSVATLVLLAHGKLPANIEATLKHWNLQSHPSVDSLVLGADPSGPFAEVESFGIEQIDDARHALAKSEWAVFARPGDLLDPSMASFLARLESTSAVFWSVFTVGQARTAGVIFHRSNLHEVTIRHNPSLDCPFALLGSEMANCPDDVLRALLSGRVHPLLFWLSTRPLPWRAHSGVLSVRQQYEGSFDARDAVELDRDCYQKLTASIDDVFDLRETRGDLPVPFVLVPKKRGATISVVILRQRGPILRLLNSIARQRTTGQIEIIVVSNVVDDSEPLLSKSRDVFGADVLRLVRCDSAFNESRAINAGFGEISGEAAVLCREDIVFEDPSILEEIAAWSLRPGVGTVGCRLEYAGTGAGIYGYHSADPDKARVSPLLVENEDETYSRVLRTSAGNSCKLMGITGANFRLVGKFDEVHFPWIQNDVDFMLRCTSRNLAHIYLGHLCAKLDCVSEPLPSREDQRLETSMLLDRYPEFVGRGPADLRAERLLS